MVERTEVEKYVRWMIASDILYRKLSSLGSKGVRRLDKTAQGIVGLLKDKADIGDRVIAKIEELKEEKLARTTKQGIDEYCKKYPKQGEILKKIIEETREKNNQYLVYSLKDGYKLGEEDYIQVMMDLGFDRREASAIYSHILTYSQREGKDNENIERKILLEEKPNKKK